MHLMSKCDGFFAVAVKLILAKDSHCLLKKEDGLMAKKKAKKETKSKKKKKK